MSGSTHHQSNENVGLSETNLKDALASVIQIFAAHLALFAFAVAIGGFATHSYIEREQMEVDPMWAVLQWVSVASFPVSGWLIWTGFRRFERLPRTVLTTATCVVVWAVGLIAYVLSIITIHIELGGTL